jgi:hypothetical protein
MYYLDTLLLILEVVTTFFLRPNVALHPPVAPSSRGDNKTNGTGGGGSAVHSDMADDLTGAVVDVDSDDDLPMQIALTPKEKEAVLAKNIGSRFAYMLVYQRKSTHLSASNAVAHAANLRASADLASANSASGDQPSAKQAIGDEASGDQASDNQAIDNQPSANQPSDNQASANQPSPNQAIGDEVSGNQASDKGVSQTNGVLITSSSNESSLVSTNGESHKASTSAEAGSPAVDSQLVAAPLAVVRTVAAEGDTLRTLLRDHEARIAERNAAIEERKTRYKALFLGECETTAKSEEEDDDQLNTNDDVMQCDSDVTQPYVLDESSTYFWIETEWLQAWVRGEVPASGPGSYRPKHVPRVLPTVTAAMNGDENGVIDVSMEKEPAAPNEPAAPRVFEGLFGAPLDMRGWVCEHGKKRGVKCFGPQSLGNLKRIDANVWTYFVSKYGAADDTFENGSIGGDFRCESCVSGADEFLDTLTRKCDEAHEVKQHMTAAVSRKLLREFHARAARAVEMSDGEDAYKVKEAVTPAGNGDGDGDDEGVTEGLVWVSTKWIKAWNEHCGDLKRLVAKAEKGGAAAASATAKAKKNGLSKYFGGNAHGTRSSKHNNKNG